MPGTDCSASGTRRIWLSSRSWLRDDAWWWSRSCRPAAYWRVAAVTTMSRKPVTSGVPRWSQGLAERGLAALGDRRSSWSATGDLVVKDALGGRYAATGAGCRRSGRQRRPRLRRAVRTRSHGEKTAFRPVEGLSVLHDDLLSWAMRHASAAFFSKRRNAGIKKPSVFRRGGDEGRTARKRHRRDSTPILSLARQSPGPHGPGLDERKKAGLLTSGSSYWLRLAALIAQWLHWSFRRPLQRRYRTGFSPVSLFSPGSLSGGTFLQVSPG